MLERVIAAIAGEGHDVTGVWYPDEDHADPRHAGRTTHPDAALTVDGREAAIDVTGFWTVNRGKAATRAWAISQSVRRSLEAADLPLCALAMLVYRPDELASLDDRRARDVDARRIAEALVAAARRSDPVQQVPIDLAGLPPWLERLSVTTVDRAVWKGRPDAMALPHREPTDSAQILEAIAASKGRQLARWGLGIVAIIHDFHETAAGIAPHLAARDDWPFWRVYWCAPDDAHLVWQAAP